MVTWLESIKTEVDGGILIDWKTFSLDQQNSQEGPDFRMWEHRDYASRGVRALVAAKAAKNQGEEAFFRFHLAAFEAKHDEGKDIAHGNTLVDTARDAGLDLVRFEEDMDKEETWQAVGKDHMEARERYDVFGVPTLVFGEGQAVFVKLESLPKSKEDWVSLFEFISDMAVKRPYLLELKRP